MNKISNQEPIYKKFIGKIPKEEVTSGNVISESLSSGASAAITLHPKQIASCIKRHHELHSRRPQLPLRVMHTALDGNKTTNQFKN
uniref:Uncharacterized protein n=1 Tax=Rhizophora mucronata TaxID=61149 RepID=A0A2P2KJ81_RHIMU